MALYLSDQEYLVSKAKSALKSDPATAKSWLITAKTLYPNNFGVQFEAYNIEKEANNVKEAAKYFSDLLNKFQQQPELWKEVERVTAALRFELENADHEKQFLKEMFKHMPLDVQHQLLLMTADHCDDTMEHCRLLLLLLKTFPQSVVTHGVSGIPCYLSQVPTPNLIETLLSAEKHSHISNQPVNSYRKLLVCDVLPLLGESNVELPAKVLFRLLHKAIEYYLSIQQLERSANEVWIKLFYILDLTGRHLGWDPYLTNVGNTWNKDSYWQKILNFCETHKTSQIDEHTLTKQLLYCLSILFFSCLHEYTQCLRPETSPGQIRINFLLVEAFVDTNSSVMASSSSTSLSLEQPKLKRRKSDGNNSAPHFTVTKPGTNQLITNFTLACNCWDLLHSTDTLQREFVKLNGHLKLEPFIADFLIDYSLYKCMYEDALLPLQPMPESTQALIRNIRVMCIYFCKRNYTTCFEHLLLVMSALPTLVQEYDQQNRHQQLTVTGHNRHLHFLPLTQYAVLQYCVRLLINIIRENIGKQNSSYNELALGVLLTLIQLDWPEQEDLLPLIMEQIRQRGVFHYPLFQAYIINIDILEDLMYLHSEHGGQVVLDIFPIVQQTQRRIGTRGADKGVKEDFKQAMKRQVAKHTDPIHNLIIQFIIQERIHILQILMS